MSCSWPNGRSSSIPLTPGTVTSTDASSSAAESLPVKPTSTSRPGAPPRTSNRDRDSSPGAGSIRARHAAMNSELRASRPSGSTSCTRRLANWSPRDPCRCDARSCWPGRATASSTRSSPKCVSVSFYVAANEGPQHALPPRGFASEALTTAFCIEALERSLARVRERRLSRHPQGDRCEAHRTLQPDASPRPVESSDSNRRRTACLEPSEPGPACRVGQLIRESTNRRRRRRACPARRARPRVESPGGRSWRSPREPRR